MTRVVGSDRVFEGFAGVRLHAMLVDAAGGQAYIRLQIHNQDVYLSPGTADALTEHIHDLTRNCA